MVTVNWTPPAGRVQSYVLEAGSTPRASDKTVVTIQPTDAYYSTSAAPGTYYVRVRSRNACGLGRPSADITVVSGVYQRRPEVLVVARTPERNTYFPSVVKLRDGRLLVVFYDSPAHVSALGRISMVESRDDGLTWSQPRVIIDTSMDDRDPSISITRSGRLLVSYFGRNDQTGLSAVFVARSDDIGATWTDAIRIESNLADYATSSTMVETADGDLLCPLYGTIEGGGNTSITIARSHDGGETWPRDLERAVVAVDGTNFTEPALAVAGSRMLVLMRVEGGSDLAYATRSLDGGVTWTPPASFGMAAQSSELVPLPNQPGLTAVHIWADWSHRWGDSRPTIAQTVRWRAGDAIPIYGEARVLYNSNCDDAGYPSGVVLDDGRLFIVFYDACLGYIGGTYLSPAALR